MGGRPRILALGDGALTVEYGQEISDAAMADVRALDVAIREGRPTGVIETVPTYRSLTIFYDPCLTSRTLLSRWLEGVRPDVPAAPGECPPLVIPVFYGGRGGPDLADVAAHCRLSEDEVVRRHSSVEYRVAMLGFQAGFPYLTGLLPQLSTPRLDSPRSRVPGGSVGIAGGQTGVYPRTSPGAWRIIGWTPLTLWDPSRAQPSLLGPGDSVRFVPVGRPEVGRRDHSSGGGGSLG